MTTPGTGSGAGRGSGTGVAGRVALVTGAGGGLGRAIVARLAADGWTTVGATHRGGPWAADLGRPGAAEALVRRVMDRHARLDLLVVNHATMAMAPVESHAPEDWWRIIEVNLGGAFRLCRAAAPHLTAASGAIVLVASEWGVTGWPQATAYAASKAGMIGLTKALARELAPAVRVNALAPGVIDTPQLEVDAAAAGVSLDEVRRRYTAAAPLGRIASPAGIAASVAFLAGPESADYTGQVLAPNGGTTLA